MPIGSLQCEDALSIAAIGTSFGGFIFPPLAAWVIAGADWRAALQLFAALFIFVAIPMFWLLVVDKPEQKNLMLFGESEREGEILSAVDQSKLPSTATSGRNRVFFNRLPNV